MAFCWIPPGVFRMGSRGEYVDEEPAHWVRVGGEEGFWMGETPVTQAQFRVWTKKARVSHGNAFSGADDLPAQNMDWRMATQYCAWLTERCRDQIPTGWRVCLPTEAEWEYACRAGTETEYWSGDGEEALERVGWYEQNSEMRTHAVGEKAGNGWGLKDMHGNVREWCHDVWREDGYRWRVEGEEDSGRQEREKEWGEGLEAMLASNRVR
ncbi:MAG: formylglycine-generating enzyme family protein, partial [Verrucomicrobiales bacterium]|nr:formylglycine-generating enzyme family protein [Verrucomicrobiales bacterium]